MSQAEELLRGLSAGATTYADDVYYVSIENRFLIVPAHLQKLGVAHDHAVNTVHFVGPRYSENGTDLSKMSIWVNYRRSEDEYEDKFLCTNVKVDSGDDTLLHYDWLITRNVTEVHGNVTVIVCAKDVDGAGNEDEHWNTEMYTDFYVSEGMEVDGDGIINQQPDLVDSVLDRINTVENKTTTASMLGYVDRYLDENPAVITDHIEDIVADQPIQEFVEGYLDDYVDIGTTDSRTLLGSVAGAYEMVSMAGASEQKTLEGKNLWTHGDVTFVRNSTLNTVLKAGTYVFSASISSSGTDVDYSRVVFYDSNNNQIAYISPIKNTRQGYIVTLTADISSIILYADGNNTQSAGDTATFANVQIELGEVMTDYEPYCGAKASPNHDYPQEVESVGPEVTVKTINKNLIDLSGWLSDIGVVHTKSGDTVTIEASKNTSGLLACADQSKAYKFAAEDAEVTLSIKSLGGLVSGNNPRIRLMNSKGDLVGDVTSSIKSVTAVASKVFVSYATMAPEGSGIKIEELQIEFGSEATPYEPHQSSSVTITLAEELRGKNDISDIIEKRNGKWGVLRRWKKAILNAANFAEITWTEYENVTFFTLPKPVDAFVSGRYLTVDAMCDKFRCDTIHPLDQLASIGNVNTAASAPQLWFGYPKGTTLDEAKTAGEIEYIYQLAEPTWTELDEASQEALDNLQAYDGATHVMVDAKVQPIVTSKYGTSEVGARAMTNTNRIEKVEEGKADKTTLAAVDERVVALEEPIQVSDGYEIHGCAPGGYRLLEMDGNTEQVQWSGKQLLDSRGLTTVTRNGLTFTPVYDNNGLLQYVNVNGTATADTAYNFGSSNGLLSFRGGSIILNGCPIGGAYNTYRIVAYPFIDGVYSSGLVVSDTGNGAKQDWSTVNGFYAIIDIKNGVTLSNAKFYPMISKEGGEYEPYLGGVELVQGYYDGSNGVYATLPSAVCTKNKIPCKSGDILKVCTENIYNIVVCYYNENGFLSVGGTNGTQNIEVTVPSGATYFNVDVIQPSGVAITPDTVGKVSLTVNGKPIYVHAGAYTGGMTSPSPYYPQAIYHTSDVVEMIQGSYNTSSGVYEYFERNVCTKNAIPCKGGDSIVVSIEKQNDVLIYWYNGNTFISSESKVSSKQASFTAPSNATRFNFKVKSSESITPDTVGKITLTINGKYVNCVKGHGKNFLDLRAFVTRNNFGVTVTPFFDEHGELEYIEANGTSTSNVNITLAYIDVKEPTEFILSGSPSNATNFGAMLRIYSPEGIALGTNNRDEGVKVTLPKGLCEVRFRVNSQNTVSNLKFYPMVRKADILDDTYEPYQEKVAYFLTEKPMMLGSTLFHENGLFKVEHGCAEKTFNGTESGWDGSNGRFTLGVSDIALESFSATQEPNVMSNMFIGMSWYEVYNSNYANGVNAICSHDTNRQLKVFSANITDLDEFKTMLASTPMIAQYKLATPTIEVLDPASQRALNSLETFNDVTYLEVDSRTQPLGIKGEYGITKLAGDGLKALSNSETAKVVADTKVTTYTAVAKYNSATSLAATIDISELGFGNANEYDAMVCMIGSVGKTGEAYCAKIRTAEAKSVTINIVGTNFSTDATQSVVLWITRK